MFATPLRTTRDSLVPALGRWESLDGAQISTPDAAISEVFNLSFGNNRFIWSVSGGECPGTTRDTLTIFRSSPPVAQADRFQVQNAGQEFDLTANDELAHTPNWALQLLVPSDRGQIRYLGGGRIRFDFPNGTLGRAQTRYQVCNQDCPEVCSEAIVELEIAAASSGIQLPNAITPNGDGQNDFFVIDLIEANDPAAFPDNRLLIFNRWGDIVYQKAPYDNTWQGQDKNGRELPPGTYYYILQLKLEDQLLFRGDISILR